MGWLLNGIDSGGIPMHIVNALLSSGVSIKYFVETGTQGGDSMAAVRGLFKQMHTIEIIGGPNQNGNNYGTTNKDDYCNRQHWGNSVNILPELIEKFDGSYALFWLDAHYSGSEPNKTGFAECPLMDEIKAVAKYPNSIILIDDARLFSGPPAWPCDPREWPKIADIFYELRLSFPKHYTTVVDDYIISIPDAFKDSIDKEWRERYHIRYPSEDRVKKLAYKLSYNDAVKNLEYFKKWMDV